VYIVPRRGKVKFIMLNPVPELLLTDLTHLKERNVEDLSGGELQRFACAVVCIQKADM
jgi:translation initiation factor RLI1